ncbi:hypothetical protein NQ318_013980 [Aromia moschata]|uniref:Uncharacterized protein n=1 Tax=Aromia moschata TaxID=1265417 RepID=A0AAV8Z0Q3_9CUCU|nr:hypothetical protein NQ318_013980 [Aromia moschata]
MEMIDEDAPKDVKVKSEKSDIESLQLECELDVLSIYQLLTMYSRTPIIRAPWDLTRHGTESVWQNDNDPQKLPGIRYCMLIASLALPLPSEAHRRAREQYGRHQRPADANPSQHVAPVVVDASVIAQHLEGQRDRDD